ncbi:MAG: DUF983 domain-containing protein [bacterium]
MFKGTKLYGILRMKCPHCQEGDFFEGHPYNLSKMGKVKKRCEKCNQKFEIETGFYQGSYYVSYALGVALFVAVVVLNYIFRDDVTPTSLMVSFVFSLFLLLPLLFALSKIIWATIFIKYNKKAIQNHQMKLQNDSRT